MAVFPYILINQKSILHNTSTQYCILHYSPLLVLITVNINYKCYLNTTIYPSRIPRELADRPLVFMGYVWSHYPKVHNYNQVHCVTWFFAQRYLLLCAMVLTLASILIESVNLFHCEQIIKDQQWCTL